MEGTTVRVGGRLHRVPPPESELWPEWCRGKLWEPAAARWFAGRCQLCAYSCQPSERRRWLDKHADLPTFLIRTNHPDCPGRMREVNPTDMCRNFEAKRWWVTVSGPRIDLPKRAADSESDPKVRRIPVGHGLFALVDARDYQKLSKYKWCASRIGRSIYAAARVEGKTVTMHRFIMKAPKGMVVHHIDGNGLNNRRCNLLVCTGEQHSGSRGPRGGTSRFVGVTRQGGRWQAGIQYQGKFYFLGSFDDEVEAAKARDRKAYELHGPLAYINLPDELQRRRRHSRRRRRTVCG